MAWSPRRGRRMRRTPAADSPRPERGASAGSRGTDGATAEPGHAVAERAATPGVFGISGPAHVVTGRDWRRVPALKLTIAPLPRLVGGVAFAVPEVSGTRLLLRPPLGASHAQAITGLDESRLPAGKVRGLISSNPAARSAPRAEQHATPAPEDGLGSLSQEPQSPSSHGLRRALGRGHRAAARSQDSVEAPPETAPPYAETPLPSPLAPPLPLRRARPVAQMRAERVSLVEATGQFVGEPQAGETPYASSAWLRMVQSYLPDAPGSPIPGMSPAGLTETVKPDGGTVRSWSSSALAEPPRVPAVPERDSAGRDSAVRDWPVGGAGATATPQAPARRANLAESRRLGLGAPLTHPRSRALDADEDEDAEAADAETEQFAPQLHQSTPRETAPTPPPAPEVSTLTFLADERAMPTTPAAPEPASPKPGPPVYRAAVSAPVLGTAQPPAGPHRHGPALSVTGELVHRPPASPKSRGAETKDTRQPTRPAETEDGWAGLTAPPPPPNFAAAPVQFAPPELAETLRQLHGVDVSNVPIRRDAEAAEHARSLGARAFTHDGQVFIPQSEGSLDQPQTRALLAHELTHAAQHRLLGSGLPDESSAAGRALEAAAVATEQWTLGQALNPRFAGHAPQATPAPGHAMRATSPPPASHPPVFQGTPSQGTPIASTAAQFVDAYRPYGTQNQDPAYALPTPGAPRVETVHSHAPVAVTTGQARPADHDHAMSVGTPSHAADAESAALSGRLARLARQRTLDLDDTAAVDELADDLYHRFHGRLRRELLIDRERSGVLGDFG